MRWQRIVFSVTVTEGLLTEVSEKRKGCGRKAIPPVVARILSGDSTSPFSRGGKFSARRRDGGDFAMVVGMAVLGATGGASKASDKCSFAKISGNNKDWCNGRSELYSVIT